MIISQKHFYIPLGINKAIPSGFYKHFQKYFYYFLLYEIYSTSNCFLKVVKVPAPSIIFIILKSTPFNPHCSEKCCFHQLPFEVSHISHTLATSLPNTHPFPQKKLARYSAWPEFLQKALEERYFLEQSRAVILAFNNCSKRNIVEYSF